MGVISKEILGIQTSDIKNIDVIFGRHAGIDMTNVSEKQKPLVEETRKVALNDFTIKAIYMSEKIDYVEGGAVHLKSGLTFSGDFITKVFEKAEEMAVMVIGLWGFEKAMKQEKNIMRQYLLDCWASTMVENASAFLKRKIRDMMKKKGLHTTSSWSPGQHGFGMANQKPVFDLLKPEEIGIILNDSMLMIPQKSESAILGIGRKDFKDIGAPCDYCEKRMTCPSAYVENI